MLFARKSAVNSRLPAGMEELLNFIWYRSVEIFAGLENISLLSIVKLVYFPAIGVTDTFLAIDNSGDEMLSLTCTV